MSSSVSFDALSIGTPDGRVLVSNLTIGFGAERTGIVGANGSGKTTLLRVLLGQQAPLAGHVTRSARIAALAQGSGEAAGTIGSALGVDHVLGALARLDAGRGGAEELAIVGDRWEVEAQARSALDRLRIGHLALDRLLSSLSGGERTRVALAALLVEPAELLVLDEPTNHLDADGRRAVHELFEVYRGGIVVVSHDRALLGHVDRILELSALGPRLYGGNYAAYVAACTAARDAAERRLEVAERAVDRTRREIQREKEKKARRDGAGAQLKGKGGIPRIMLGMMKESSEQSGGRHARSAQQRLDEVRAGAAEARQEVEIRAEITARVAPVDLPAARRVLWLDGVSVGRPPLFAPVTLALHGPERVAIAGPNGCGKSTLLRLVAGLQEPDRGVVVRGATRMAWVDQDTALLRPERTVWENYRDHDPEGTTSALARFSLPHDLIHRPVGTLSGGERVRAALACVLGARQPAELILLDEPTNHLDLPSVEAIERALDGYRGALVVVSHDPAFLERIGVTRVVELVRDQPVGSTTPHLATRNAAIFSSGST